MTNHNIFIMSQLRYTYQWWTRQLSNSCLSLNLARRSAVSYRFSTDPDSQYVSDITLFHISLLYHHEGYLCFTTM